MTVTHNLPAGQHHRWVFPLAVVTSVAMLVAWFPLTTLWHQQSQIDATAHQIALVRQQQSALTRQAQSISTKAAATLLARQEYQLVAPGQSLIQVLPGATDAAGPGGDPGNQPLVAPSSVSSLVGSNATVATHHSSLGGFLTRFVRTLEFWR